MLDELIATHLGHKRKCPAYVINGRDGLSHIKVFGNLMGTIFSTRLAWYPIVNGLQYNSEVVILQAADPKFFKRLDSLVSKSIVDWIERGDSYAIWWMKYGRNRKTS